MRPIFFSGEQNKFFPSSFTKKRSIWLAFAYNQSEISDEKVIFAQFKNKIVFLHFDLKAIKVELVGNITSTVEIFQVKSVHWKSR